MNKYIVFKQALAQKETDYLPVSSDNKDLVYITTLVDNGMFPMYMHPVNEKPDYSQHGIAINDDNTISFPTGEIIRLDERGDVIRFEGEEIHEAEDNEGLPVEIDEFGCYSNKNIKTLIFKTQIYNVSFIFFKPKHDEIIDPTKPVGVLAYEDCLLVFGVRKENEAHAPLWDACVSHRNSPIDLHKSVYLPLLAWAASNIENDMVNADGISFEKLVDKKLKEVIKKEKEMNRD